MMIQMQTKSYIEHVVAVHKDRMGAQRGWDRYLDSHIGLIYRDTFLDDIAPTLVENVSSPNEKMLESDFSIMAVSAMFD